VCVCVCVCVVCVCVCTLYRMKRGLESLVYLRFAQVSKETSLK